VEKGQTERKVVIPPGTWISDEGETVVGPKTVTVKTPLSRLPYFTLKR
jgi:alpha-glucosidase (family GH31 glycosyl hydrolase)